MSESGTKRPFTEVDDQLSAGKEDLLSVKISKDIEQIKTLFGRVGPSPTRDENLDTKTSVDTNQIELSKMKTVKLNIHEVGNESDDNCDDLSGLWINLHKGKEESSQSSCSSSSDWDGADDMYPLPLPTFSATVAHGLRNGDSGTVWSKVRDQLYSIISKTNIKNFLIF